MLGRWLREIGALGPAFNALLLSQILSIAAVMVGHVATGWWIAQQGGGGDLALYASITAAGMLICLPLLSPIGDRYCKRSVMAVAMAISTLVAAALALLAQTGRYDLTLIIVIDLAGAAAGALFMPASASIVADLLPAEQLTAGLSLQKGGQALGRLVGPVLGGGAVALGGTAATLWLYALLMGLSLLLSLRMPKQPVAGASAAGAASWVREIKAGLAAKWHIRIERWWTLVSFLFALFMFPGIGMLLPLKIQSLHLDSVWLGLSEAALSAGLLAGSLGLSSWACRRFGRFETYMASILSLGLSFVAVGISQRGSILLGAWVVVGFAMAVVQLVGQTHRMLAIPPSFRSRMSSVQLMVMQVAGSLGPALGGLGLGTLGVDGVYRLFGCVILVVGVSYAFLPGYRAFIGLSHEAVKGFYGRTYPQLFKPGEAD